MSLNKRQFRPLPFLSNPHLQTVLAALWKGPPFPHPSTIRAVDLSDGDRLALHDSVPPSWKPGDLVAVIVHGLGGSPDSGFIRRTADALFRRGVRPVRMDLRGSGAGMPWAKRGYHAGSSTDVHEAVEEVARWMPGSPIVVIGFSLGGNIVLKFAGELTQRPCPAVTRVISIAPPIDLSVGSAVLARPSNRFYDWYFSRDLVRLVRLRAEHFPNDIFPEFPPRMSVRLFDEIYTAPTWGFAGPDEYYQLASAAPLIDRIPVPTFILTAQDDPVIPVEPFRRLKLPPDVELRIEQWGGHLGFLGSDGRGGLRWAERLIVEKTLEG